MSFVSSLSPEIVRLLMILVATFVGYLAVGRALQHAEKVAERTHNIWDDALINAAKSPLTIVVWLTGVSFALQEFHRQSGEQMLEYVSPVRNIGVIICVSWFLFKLINEVAKNVIAAHVEAGEEVDRTTIDGLSKVSRIIVLVAAVLGVMQTLGFSISGVMAFGGMGGIAVGFAAKDMLSNFFGGLMIHLDRPFKVGETVRSPDRQIEGRVEYIGWRQTIIRSRDMIPIYVPNSLFSTIVVENPSRMSHRRIREMIGLRYDDIDKMSGIIDEVKVMLSNHPEVDSTQALVVAFDQFADSSLNFFIHTFTKTSDFARFHEVKQDVLLKTAAIIAKHRAEIAFPTRTLHMHQPSA